MRYTFGKLINLIFPARCIFCGEPIDAGSTLLFCPKCQSRYGAERERAFLPGIGSCRYALSYRTQARAAILRYKFGRRAQYAKTLAYFMRPLVHDADADLITWVPIGFLRYVQRTYDQSRLLAEELSRESGIPLAGTLRKIRHNQRQSRLDAAARKRNVRGCYRAIAPERIEGKRILLLDDIVTTGSTLAECMHVLYDAGAKEVICIALAHGSAKQIQKEKR